MNDGEEKALPSHVTDTIAMIDRLVAGGSMKKPAPVEAIAEPVPSPPPPPVEPPAKPAPAPPPADPPPATPKRVRNWNRKYIVPTCSFCGVHGHRSNQCEARRRAKSAAVPAAPAEPPARPLVTYEPGPKDFKVKCQYCGHIKTGYVPCEKCGGGRKDLRPKPPAQFTHTDLGVSDDEIEQIAVALCLAQGQCSVEQISAVIDDLVVRPGIANGLRQLVRNGELFIYVGGDGRVCYTKNTASLNWDYSI